MGLIKKIAALHAGVDMSKSSFFSLVGGRQFLYQLDATTSIPHLTLVLVHAIAMSFGYSVGDFLALLNLANIVRKQFVDAPAQFKAVSDE